MKLEYIARYRDNASRFFISCIYKIPIFFQVIDFGSSCYEHQRVYTYIQSRFYRAPEVILGARYGMPIDMWSLGCILAELLTGYPLLPGEDEADQLSCIIELLGMPPQKLLDQSKRAKNFISSKGNLALWIFYLINILYTNKQNWFETKYFITWVLGYPRYCTATTLPDGTTVLNGGRSRRGKPRGPPGSRELQTALKGTRSLYLIYLFETYVGDLRVVTILFLCNRMRRSPVSGLHSAMFGVGSDDTDEPKLCPSACLAQVFTFTIKYYIIRYIFNEGRLHYSFKLFYRRRLPRPPPVGGSTDSPSGTLNSTSSSMLRTPTASNSSRTSRDISTANPSMSQKMNTISTVGSSGGQSAKVCICSYHWNRD